MNPNLTFKCDLDLGSKDQVLAHDTLSQNGQSYAPDTNPNLTFECDLDLGSWDLVLARNTLLPRYVKILHGSLVCDF